MFIVDDPERRVASTCPTTYGVDDVPVIVQDRSFDDDNQFGAREPLFGQMGPLGDELLVNGTWNPHLDVTTERVRLRLLERVERPHLQLPLRRRPPVRPDRHRRRPARDDRRRSTALQLSPGERAEVVVDDGGGGAGRAAEHRAASTAARRRRRSLPGRRRTRFDVLELRAAGRPRRRRRRCPAELATIDRPAPADAVTTRTFDLDNNKINGRQMDMDRIDEVVTVGTHRGVGDHERRTTCPTASTRT